MEFKELKETDLLDIIKRFEDGETIKSIGALYQVYTKRISEYLQSLGFSTSNKNIIKLESDIDKIINLYLSGESIVSISKTMKCGEKQVSKILKENNVEIINKGLFLRKFFINEDYLDVIDSEDKAYFLGFMASDGNVSSSSSRKEITICLKKDDDNLDLLEKIKKSISYTGNINTYRSSNGYEYLSLRFSSTGKLYYRLIELGISPNKTHTLDFKEIYSLIPCNLKHHFIRGYFDGDGCISCSKIENREKIVFGFSITATIQTCRFLKEILNIETALYIYKDSPNIADIKSSKKSKIYEMYRYMYLDATIFLKRKKERFLLFLEQEGYEKYE